MPSIIAISSCIAKNYEGGPVGIETISAALSEPRDALEEIVEPYLLQQGFIGRTPRGRVLTLRAYRHLGLSGPARAATPQIGLFEEIRKRRRQWQGGFDASTLGVGRVPVHFHRGQAHAASGSRPRAPTFPCFAVTPPAAIPGRAMGALPGFSRPSRNEHRD